MEEALALLDEFKILVHDIYGMYHDTTSAYHLMHNHVLELQNRISATTGQTIEYLDSVPWSYGEGDPWEKDSQVLHTVATQAELKQRMLPNGKNSIILGQLIVTQIYQYWNDTYRGKLEKALELEKNALKSNVFGDIRLFRNSIVHHRAIALKEIEKCELYQWFKEEDLLSFNSEQIKQIIVGTLSVIDKLAKEIEVEIEKNNPC